MAHEIDQTTGRPALAYSREGGSVWHGLGTELPAAVSANQIIHAAGLNWDVEVRQLYTKTPTTPGLRPIATDFVDVGAWGTFRSDTEALLGTVGEHYKPIQIRTLTSFAEQLLIESDEEVRFHSAGSLDSGRRVFILAELGEHMRVGELGDEYRKYLFLNNHHDGKGSMNCLTTCERVICGNTERFALDTADFIVRVTHTGDVLDKVDDARRLLGIVNTQYDERKAKLEEWASMQMTTEPIRSMQHYLFPGDTPQMRQRRWDFGQFLRQEMDVDPRYDDRNVVVTTDGIEGNVTTDGLTVFNVVTGLTNHAQRVQSSVRVGRTKPMARALSVLQGRAHELNLDASVFLDSFNSTGDVLVRDARKKGPATATLGTSEATVQA